MPPNEIAKLRKELLLAYKLIRAQTIQICDLHSLVAPLIRALGTELAESRQRWLEAMTAELDRERSDSLALLDEVIRRLKVP